MSAAKKGLGRGFESLIPTGLIDDSFDPNTPFDPTASEDKKVSEQTKLPLSSIEANSDQPRKIFDETALEELAASIKEHGVLQPIIVVPQDEGYQIVAGERRFRASQIAGMEEIPVIIRTMTGQHQLEVSLIENIQRRDLNTIETATAYAKLRDQFNLTNDQIAQRVHKSVPAVVNTMRLLKLPKEVIALIAEGQLSGGQARPLVGQDEDTIVKVIPKIIAEGWSVRKVEQYIVNLKKKAEGKEDETQAAATSSQHEARIEALRNRLNAKVDIRTNSKGAGKIVIGFKNPDELARIQELLES